MHPRGREGKNDRVCVGFPTNRVGRFSPTSVEAALIWVSLPALPNRPESGDVAGGHPVVPTR